MRLAAIAVWISVILASATEAAAQDFRVETDVFLDKKKEPVSQYLTLFKAGVVYDFMREAPHEVTIYDVQRGRFMLLAPTRTVQTTVTLDQLLQLTAQIQAQASLSDDEDVRFMAEPKFDVRYDPSERLIELASKRLTYAAKGIEPPNGDAGIVRRYENFANGYARLNGLRLGNMPPFARMQLNEQLAQHGWVPEVVTKKVVSRAAFGKEVEIRSRHLFSWRILPTDEGKIDETYRQMQTFQNVRLEEYLNWPKTR